MFDEFKLLFLDSAKQLILPIREGYLALLGEDELLDDEFQGALNVLALDLEFSAVKAFLQDGRFCDDELDIFMEIHGFLNRPLKKCSSNALVPLISKPRAISTRLRSDFAGSGGLFAGLFAHFGRTYPRAYA